MANLQRVLDINKQFASSPTGSLGYTAAPSAGRTLNAVNNAPQTQNIPQDQPDYAELGDNILGMLQRAQQGLNQTQMQQTERATAPLPSDLSGMRLSPGQIKGFRAGEAQTLEPTIGGQRALIKESSDLLKELKEQEETTRARASDLVSLAIEQGSEGLDSLLRESPEVFKKAGYNTKEFEAVLKGLKSKEAEDKRRFDITHPPKIPGGSIPTGGGIPGVNSSTGQKYSYETAADIANLPVSILTKSVISGYGDVKSLTPTDKSLVQQELYLIGFNPYEQINRKLDSLLKAYEEVGSSTKGILQGYAPSRFSASAAKFESQKQLLTREVARLRDVGVLSDQDVASYTAAMPARTDRNYEVASAKVEGVKTALGSGLVDSTASSIKVIAPNGKTYSFSSQEQAEAFKRAINK